MGKALAEFGSVDISINNAGIQFVAPIDEFPVDKWNAILALNVTASFHTIRLALPLMKAKKRGRIVNIASAHALVASPFKSAYVAAKHGIAGLTKTVALEVAEQGITMNAICPGYVWTPLVEKQIPDTARAPGIDIERDILRLMDFAPLLPHTPALMDARIFAHGPMGLHSRILARPLAARIDYRAPGNELCIHFEGYSIHSAADIEAVRDAVVARVAPLNRRVRAIVNYERFTILPERVEPWTAMVKALDERYYSDVVRYASSAFARMKLGEVLQAGGRRPNVFETEAAARSRLDW